MNAEDSGFGLAEKTGRGATIGDERPTLGPDTVRTYRHIRAERSLTDISWVSCRGGSLFSSIGLFSYPAQIELVRTDVRYQ